MRRRIDLAGALVADPPVLFLDEPTTGLDPRARAALWDTISELVAAGSTLLLTTQYMEEADHLADQIMVVDHGRAIARGTADELKDQVGGNRVELTVTSAAELETARQALAWVAAGAMQTVPESLHITAPVADGPEALRQVLGRLADEGVRVRDAGLRRPTLDDVYLTLTGRHASGAEEQVQEAAR
jgi:ABC-2 type transport system ATP-binding protein